MVRSANTGISALIDPYGRVRERIKLGETGVMDFLLPTKIVDPPFYSKVGELGTIILFILIISIACIFRHK